MRCRRRRTVLTGGHDLERARLLLLADGVLADAVEGAVVLRRSRPEVECGGDSVGREALLRQLLAVVAVVEEPAKRHHRGVGVHLRKVLRHLPKLLGLQKLVKINGVCLFSTYNSACSGLQVREHSVLCMYCTQYV